MSVLRRGLATGALRQIFHISNSDILHISRKLLTSFIFSIVNVRNNKKHVSEGKIREYFSAGHLNHCATVIQHGG